MILPSLKSSVLITPAKAGLHIDYWFSQGVPVANA